MSLSLYPWEFSSFEYIRANEWRNQKETKKNCVILACQFDFMKNYLVPANVRARKTEKQREHFMCAVWRMCVSKLRLLCSNPSPDEFYRTLTRRCSAQMWGREDVSFFLGTCMYCVHIHIQPALLCICICFPLIQRTCSGHE